MNFFWIVCFVITQQWTTRTVIADFSPTKLSEGKIDGPVEETLDLVPINDRDFRSNITKNISVQPWHDDRQERYIIRCVRPTKCEKITTKSCFGAKILYDYTSVELSDEGSQDNVVKRLKQLEALRNVPKCWAVIQPFLCAVYLPKCTKSKGKEYVYLPSYEMCRVTAEPCRILYDTDFFPNYLKCSDKVFPCRNCSNDVRDMKFTTISSQCMLPLVPTDSAINYHPDIGGCGLQCKDPMYTNEEHEAMQTLIFWGTLLCIICNVFVIATFLIHDWKHSKHPAWNLFYISTCFFFNWIGWMLQFIPGHRENIICRRDGTLRYSEPSAGDNLACIVPFILIYYFLMAASIWFSIFTYAWYLQTKERGTICDRIVKEGFYFHFFAWALPFFLTVAIMVFSEVDGNSITGICFVGYRNRTYRHGFVLIPVAIAFAISILFSIKGGINLRRIRHSASKIEVSKTLNSHIMGMGIRTMLIVFFIAAFFIIEAFEMRNAHIWAKSLNDLIVCKMEESYSNDLTQCKLQNRPSVAVLQLRLICLFCVNLVVSSWCWTWPALNSWKRFLKKKIGYELSEDEKFTKPKHQIIADTYHKRKDDVISVSIENSHTDPAGINFDVNNLVESDIMTQSFLNYLPNINIRRNAINKIERELDAYRQGGAYADNNSEISVSEYSLQVIKTVESRRNSDVSQVSQVSVTMSETNFKATQKHNKMSMKAKKRQNKYITRTSRRESSSSLESQRITSQMINMKCGRNQRIQMNSNAFGRQIERRSAIAAATPADIIDIKQILYDRCKQTTTDDDISNDETMALNAIMPSNMNMLVPIDTHKHQMADSNESLDAPNPEQIIDRIRNSTDKELKELLRSYEARKSGRSGQNQRNSSLKVQMYGAKMHDMATSVSSESSISENLDEIKHMDGTRSSFSDHSINRTNTQSQNSKGSCDVGIQCDDFLSRNRHSRDDCDKDNFTEKRKSKYRHDNEFRDDDYIEKEHLLSGSKRSQPKMHRFNTSGSKRYAEIGAAEREEKMKKLLLMN